MQPDGHISLPDFEELNVYKSGKNRPKGPMPWVRFYVAVLDDYELARLPIATRHLHDRLRLLAGRHQNVIPNDPEWLAHVMFMEVEDVRLGLDQLAVLGRINYPSQDFPRNIPG